MKLLEAQDINTFWEKIVNTINDGVMLVDPDGTIMFVNKAFEKLTGYSSEELVGRRCDILGCDVCESYMRKNNSSTWCRLFQEGHPDIEKNRCTIRFKNGHVIPVLKNASVFWNENQVALGAVETLTDISEVEKLDNQVSLLSKQVNVENDFLGMVGRSLRMQQVFEMIKRAGKSHAPVIIFGESGTGKELAASAIHLYGSRKNGPFIQLNCAALNESVLESELFGHAKGAFTGAYNHRTGRFEAANHGDFFLDEIGDMPLAIQTKLLRVLESGQFERVGEITPRKVDVRIITATNRKLEEMVKREEFREDLFYRINVIPIHLPPLRERNEDIPLLVNAFMKTLNMKTGKNIERLSHEAMNALMQYHWPGNIRELKNALEYAYVTAEGETVYLDHLPHKLSSAESVDLSAWAVPGKGSASASHEKTALMNALRQTGGNQTEAARLLNVNRVTVWNRMKKYGIDIKKVMAV